MPEIFLFPQVSRPQVVKKLWAYLKEKDLQVIKMCCGIVVTGLHAQDKENRQWFTPDKTMEPVFGKERQKCFGMSKHLKEHLTNPDK